MTVSLTVSNTTVVGPEANDALAGGGTGIDFGQVSNGGYSPVLVQEQNTGALDIWVSHDAEIDPITSVKIYAAPYTGTYGGANSAEADFTALLNYGASDIGASKNNADGFSRGLHLDLDWKVSPANQFDYSREAAGNKRIFGKDYAGFDGSDLTKSFKLHADAMSYWNGVSEVDATDPVEATIGKSDDEQLGNRGHFKARFYLNKDATEGGFLQNSLVIAYSFTA